MICKSCRTTMAKANLHGVLIDRCGTCEGIWLDGGELDQILKGEGTDSATVLAQAKKEQVDEARKLSVQAMCPRCGKQPLKRVWETRGNVWLDRCPDCKGLWFDAGELQRVRAADGEAGQSIWTILKKKLFG